MATSAGCPTTSDMVTIGIISEGRTDQVVIQHVLLGWFAEVRDQLEVTPVFPPEPSLAGGADGGWERLKSWLVGGAHRQILQFRDYVVVHIDADVCDRIGFGVSRQDPETGAARDPMALRAVVIEQLVEWMGRDFCASYGDRILFAVAVDAVECWLLPLIAKEQKAQAKTAGCLKAANRALTRLRQRPLSDEDGKNKEICAYRQASRPYLKRKTLMSLGVRNPSLAAFLEELGARRFSFDA